MWMMRTVCSCLLGPFKCQIESLAAKSPSVCQLCVLNLNSGILCSFGTRLNSAYAGIEYQIQNPLCSFESNFHRTASVCHLRFQAGKKVLLPFLFLYCQAQAGMGVKLSNQWCFFLDASHHFLMITFKMSNCFTKPHCAFNICFFR